MQAHPHTTFAKLLMCAAVAVFVAAPGASAAPNHADCRLQLPSGPFVTVPCPPGHDPQHKSTLASSAESSRLDAARAQERYYSSYGTPDPTTWSVEADDGGLDWAAIGIAVGGTCLLVGALIMLVRRTRRRAGRVRAVA